MVRLSRLEDLLPLSQLVDWVTREGGPSASNNKVRNEVTPTIANAATGEKKKVIDEAEGAKTTNLTPENLENVWQQVLSQTGFILSTELRKIDDVAIIGPNALVLRIPAGYNDSGNQYLDDSRLRKVEEVLAKIVGQPCSLRLETTELKPGEANPAEVEASLPSSAKRQRHRSEVAQDPLVGKAMQVLGGQIVQMDEEFGAANSRNGDN